MKTYNIGETGHLISFAHPLRVKKSFNSGGRWLFIYYEGDMQISVDLDRDLYDWTNYWYHIPEFMGTGLHPYMMDGWTALPISLYSELPNIIEVVRKHL